MSAVLLPLIAAGGIYLAIDAFSGKTRKRHRTYSIHSHPDSTSSTTELKTKTTETSTSTKSAPVKSRRKRRQSKVNHDKSLLSVRLGDHMKKIEKETRKLFVFYSFGEKNKDWDYKNLPTTWKMKKRVISANRTSKYNNVDIFSGEKKYQDKMRDYLEKAFLQLKANGIVKDYRIRGINRPI